MLGIVIRRELLANITSVRFVITLLLITIVFIVSGFVFVNWYKQEIESFAKESNANLSGLNEVADNLSEVASYVQMIYKKPQITQLFCEGYEHSLPNTFGLNVFSTEDPEISASANFFLKRFSDIDWVFVISLILSFVAFLMTFDSISAEKERGTLPLVMSNGIPRHIVVLGKYLSAMLTMIVPLMIGLLLNLIIINLRGLSISGIQWLKIVIFVGISICYLSIFLLMGILVSSRSSKSSSSIVALLFIWVVIVMIIPAFGRIISENYVNVPTRSEIDRRIDEEAGEIWENSDRYGENAGSWGADPNADWVNPPARARLFNAFTEARNKIEDDHINQWVAQVNLGRNITKISPTILYHTVSESIFGTGIVRFHNLYEQLKQYQETLKHYVIDTDRQDPDSWHLLAEFHPVLLSQKPVDYNTIPKFSESEVPISSALKNTVWDIGALILLNVLLFIAVHVAFLRCDVRQQ